MRFRMHFDIHRQYTMYQRKKIHYFWHFFLFWRFNLIGYRIQCISCTDASYFRYSYKMVINLIEKVLIYFLVINEYLVLHFKIWLDMCQIFWEILFAAKRLHLSVFKINTHYYLDILLIFFVNLWLHPYKKTIFSIQN